MDASIAGSYAVTPDAQHTETLVHKASPALRGGAAVRAPLAVFAAARCSIASLVAIGGITLQNASQAFGAGVDAAVVIGAIFEAGDIGACGPGFTQLYQP